MNKQAKMSLSCLQMANTLIDMAKSLDIEKSVDELCQDPEQALKVVEILSDTADNITMAMANIRLEILLRVSVGQATRPLEGEGTLKGGGEDSD